MRISVIGQGGREHALVRALHGNELFAWPGSDAIFELARPFPACDLAALPAVMKKMRIELCIVGPEAYLDKGLADRCRAKGIPVLGPSQKDARLETDKVFAKRFMARHRIPAAPYKIITDIEDIKAPCVLKFSRLAGGKGTCVCRTILEARRFAQKAMAEKVFGDGQLIAESLLTGKELSVICTIAEGEYHILPPARDYKPLRDGDRGPNTGGMGTVASRDLEKNSMADIEALIIRPTVAALRHYRGFLYFGLMLTPDGPKVLEYNCRMGDPEAQAMFPLIKGSLAEYFRQAAEGFINRELVRFSPGWTVCVTAAAGKYPQGIAESLFIQGLEKISGDIMIYHAGSRRAANGKWRTNGGRIIGLTAKSADLATAREHAYAALQYIQFKGMQFRTDIGKLHF